MKFSLKILIKIQELSTFHQFFGKEKFYFWKKNYRTCDDDVSDVCPCAPCAHDYCYCCFCDVVAPRSNGCPNRTVSGTNGTRNDGARNDVTSANLNFQNDFGIPFIDIKFRIYSLVFLRYSKLSFLHSR